MKQWLWTIDFWFTMAFAAFAWAALYLAIYVGKRQRARFIKWAEEDRKLLKAAGVDLGSKDYTVLTCRLCKFSTIDARDFDLHFRDGRCEQRQVVNSNLKLPSHGGN